jgi:hypothetical protein
LSLARRIGGMTGLSDAELDAMQQRADAASRAPWRSWIEDRDHECGSSFIQVGSDDDRDEDMYVSRDDRPISDADLDFIAGARQDIPRLIAEVRRLRARTRPQGHLDSQIAFIDKPNEPSWNWRLSRCGGVLARGYERRRW